MNLEDLKRKAQAQAATQGEWERDEDYPDVGGHVEIAGPATVGCYSSQSRSQANADADYIAAANPAVVLELIAELEAAQADLAVTNKLLEDRQKVLDAIPECAPHGKCVPHALEWIEKAKHLSAIATSYINKLNLRAGDILCVKVAAKHVPRYWIGSEGFAELKSILPDGVQCLIYPDGADISKMEEAVIRKAGWVREPAPDHKSDAAKKTLEGMDYTYHGGSLWKPPIGKAPQWLRDDTPSLLPQLNEFKAAAHTFVDRVRSGEIRSKSTYATFVKLLGEYQSDSEWSAINNPEPVCPSSLHDQPDPSQRRAVRMGDGRIHKATDAELDELIAQVEASGAEVVITGGQRAGRKTLLERIKAAVARHRDGGVK